MESACERSRLRFCRKMEWLHYVPRLSRSGTIRQRTKLEVELFGWPFECNDRNFAGRLLLIGGIGGKYFYCSRKRLFSLIARENPGGGIKFLTTNLNRNFRVSQQVQIPLRMFRIASFGRYCKYAITISSGRPQDDRDIQALSQRLHVHTKVQAWSVVNVYIPSTQLRIRGGYTTQAIDRCFTK